MSKNIYQNYDDTLFAEVHIPKKYWYFRYKWLYEGNWEDVEGLFVGEFADLFLKLYNHDTHFLLIMSQEITKEDYEKLEGIVG